MTAALSATSQAAARAATTSASYNVRAAVTRAASDAAGLVVAGAPEQALTRLWAATQRIATAAGPHPDPNTVWADFGWAWGLHTVGDIGSICERVKEKRYG